MKVLFTPFDARNPYQTNLVINLKNVGVEVNSYKYQFPFGLSRYNHDSEEKYDLIHLHWLHPLILDNNSIMKSFIKTFLFIIDLLLVKIKKRKIVWTVHNYKHHESSYPHLELSARFFVAKICDQVLVHSFYAKQKISEGYNISPEKIKVIYHGNYINNYPNISDISQQSARKKLNLPLDKRIFLFFGNVRKYKGLNDLIEAFFKIKNEKKFLLVAGRPHDFETQINLRDLDKKNNNISTFLRFIPDKQVVYFFQAADLVVLPYKNFLTSGAAVLAMSMSKPIIAPKHPFFCEILNLNKKLLYHKDNKVRSISNLLQKSIEKPKLLENIGKDNFLIAKNKFSLGKIAEAHKKTYEKVKSTNI